MLVGPMVDILLHMRCVSIRSLHLDIGSMVATALPTGGGHDAASQSNADGSGLPHGLLTCVCVVLCVLLWARPFAHYFLIPAAAPPTSPQGAVSTDARTADGSKLPHGLLVCVCVCCV
jgi:hypothetical protein